MSNPPQFAPYQQLLNRAREIALIEGTGSLLSWDQETYMPPKALPFRAEQVAHLSGWTHRLFTAPEVGDWIKACEDHGFTSDSDEGANVREWRRHYDRQTKIPVELVEEFQRTTAVARDVWVNARQRSEFPLFQPHLEKILSLSRQMADHWGYERCRYDALLEGHERGARAEGLKTLFAELRQALVPVLSHATARSTQVAADLLDADYALAEQQAFNRQVAEAMGFDFEAGRIDTTTHPFCTGLGPGDCRLTTRYNPRNFTQSLYGIMHEAGHGLYDQGLPPDKHGTPLGSAASVGIHESQSRLWENHVGRSRLFWEHWHAAACRHFPWLSRWSAEQIIAAVNRVAPSFIRVEADEVTYDLHIILRFGLELRLTEGELKVADVPAAWNEEFQALFGLTVPKDALGCLQDIHWSLGALGYFPTYTLGNLNASQLMHAALREQPAIGSDLARGQYQSLLAWLRTKVHQHGQRYGPQELMQSATGEPTRAHHHFEYLQQKFLGTRL